jgi:hypothetical protein
MRRYLGITSREVDCDLERTIWAKKLSKSRLFEFVVS